MKLIHRKKSIRQARDQFILSSLPPPLPQSPPQTMPLHGSDNPAKKELLKTGIIIMACMVGATILIGILCRILRAKYERNLRRTTREPIIFATEDDFVDGDQGPEIDHHIWYINTIGLQQSVIDAIAVFKYKKDEALIEGTECSVCLNEFQEDESLRLLPKCSHAFHLPCIDTWLRSHKNCPLCRAPIVCDSSAGLSVPSSSELSSREEPQIDNSENNEGFISIQVVGEGGSNEVRNGDGRACVLPIEDETNTRNSKMSLSPSILRNHSRVQSDLVESRQAAVETEMQPIRRSVSVDSSAALAIYNAVANVVPTGRQQGSSDAQLQPKNLKLKNVAKRGSGGSLSFHKLMISSSIGRSLQKGPVLMKRSFSTSGKCSSSRVSSSHSKSQGSILSL